MYVLQHRSSNLSSFCYVCPLLKCKDLSLVFMWQKQAWQIPSCWGDGGVQASHSGCAPKVSWRAGEGARGRGIPVLEGPTSLGALLQGL